MIFHKQRTNQHKRALPLAAALGLIIAPVAGALAEEPPAANTQEELRALERLLYERMNDPTFDVDLRFIRGVPLISRTSEFAPDSQYYTSLLLQARQAASSLFSNEISQFVLGRLDSRPDVRSLRPERVEIMAHAMRRSVGDRSAGLWAALPAWGPHPHQHAPDGSHSHGREERAPAPAIPGFVVSRGEATTGLHALAVVDASLRTAADRRGALLGLLGAPGIRWQFVDRDPRPSNVLRRYIDKSIPFVLHREQGDLLVCGYARHGATTYLMGYDLMLIERKVTLSSGGGGLSYSEYRRFVREAQDPGSEMKLDPLFWDYTSYFSSTNLPSFRLVPVEGSLLVTAIYPTGIDNEFVDRILNEEIVRIVPLRGTDSKPAASGAEPSPSFGDN
jgi:hypothetical protein